MGSPRVGTSGGSLTLAARGGRAQYSVRARPTGRTFRPRGSSGAKAAGSEIEVEEEAMPLYEYACGDCGSTFERLRKQAERDEALRCPECGGVASAVFSAAAVHASGGAAARAPLGPHGGPCCGGGACGMG